MFNRRLVIVAAICMTCIAGAQEPGDQAVRRNAQKAYNDGNYKDALELFKRLTLKPDNAAQHAGNDMNMAINCLNNLGRTNEIDALREAAIEAHSDKWQVLQAAGISYLGQAHYGYMIAGQFRRGQHRGGGRYINAVERDRGRALQLFNLALPLAKGTGNYAGVCENFANALLNNRGYQDAWRLQTLTDLSHLPDYDEGYGYSPPRLQGAPVDRDGNAVFYKLPRNFAAAASDGERWRWLLAEAMTAAPGQKARLIYQFATFLRQQFGVQTLQQYGIGLRQDAGRDEETTAAGILTLHTLGEDETVARLATGVKRFKLPAAFRFLQLYKDVAALQGDYRDAALQALATSYQNRRQYAKAAVMWRRSIEEGGASKYKQQALDQIVGNWGAFEPGAPQAPAKGATVQYRYRNGRDVRFIAHEIDVPKLLADVKAYLKSNPGRLDGNRINLGNIGFRLVRQHQSQYVGKKTAEWTLKLQPRPGHFDRRIEVTTPMQRPGAYLLEGRMTDGNVSRIIVWVTDTVIVRKPLSESTLYFVTDAITGRPLPRANVEFFGYRTEYIRDKALRRAGRQFNIQTRQYAEFTDDDGLVIVDGQRHPRNYQWLVIVRTDDGRLAHMGFSGIWYGRYDDQDYNQTKGIIITDRPVYRPGQTVRFKAWVRHARYDQPDQSDFANHQFNFQIHSPKGDELLKKNFTADAFGGFDGEYTLPADAPLGVYRMRLPGIGYGQNTFRVEEYKKPEFEVTVEAPDEPVMLGEVIEAKITARYYFGAPVTKAHVKYKIRRCAHTAQWFPTADWDWFYGPGYWWFGDDYPWYPGWDEWGCRRPRPWWRPWNPTPPELVAEQEMEIGADGTVRVAIDTAVAKAIHGDLDHRYEITAEVVDQSRRTIVGSGQVLVARRPFKVYAWLDRGHYPVGDPINASFQAQTLDRKPVSGKGVVQLYKIRYKDGRPQETAVRRWDLAADDQGRAQLKLKASEPGQYRLSYTVTDADGHAVEGGYVFVVRGPGYDSADFRFNDLELIPDRQSYRPGEKVALLVNTDRRNSTVLLFLRPANGIYLKPKVMRLHGKSAAELIEVTRKDMPNFFIEALTVANGRVHEQMKEIVVPPEKRVLDVEVLPSAATYKPGAPAKVRIKVSEHNGEPYDGSLVISVYDKAVEYISGGSNVPEIRAHFWKWRRRHNPRHYSNLMLRFGNVLETGEVGMGFIGVFGRSVADVTDDNLTLAASPARAMKFRRAVVEEGAVMPMAAAGSFAKMSEAVPGEAEAADSAGAGIRGQRGEPTPAVVQPTVRTQFADTAFWSGSLTARQGVAEVDFDMPENLTGWKIQAWVMGQGTRVGHGETVVTTAKNLLLRLQAPRFFVEKDEVVLSANIHNYLKTAKKVRAVLELDGGTLEPLTAATQTVQVTAGGEQRVDWRVKAVREGEAVVRMKALTDEESDAMQMTFPVHVHGMMKTVSYSGHIARDATVGSIVLDVPRERRVNDSRLEIRYSPTLAGAMVDALPYLVEYPYGCTEQTLNRFLPTVITQKILLDTGIDLQAVAEKRTNLNAQEIGDDRERARQWQRGDRNPVFDATEVNKMVKDGLEALTMMQLSDGGWGWFSGWRERSYPHTTAYVVHGLQIARDNGVAIVPGVLRRGVEWLHRYQDTQVQQLKNATREVKRPGGWKTHADNLDAFVYMVLGDADVLDTEMRDYLYRDRNNLAVYAKAMFGIALHKQKQYEQRDMIIRNIDQYLVMDDENQTAYLRLPNGGYWWCWYGSEYEAHAYYLKLLSRTEPKGKKAPWLVKYLLNNRKHATYWNSTRDTAICVEAFADYMRASGEDAPNLKLEVLVDGHKRQEVRITKDNLFTFNNKFILVGDAVETGRHTVELRKTGTGPIYFNAYLNYFSLEDAITRAGLEVKVNRAYYKLTPRDKTIKVAGAHGQAVDQKVEKYSRTRLDNLAQLKSGDLLEVELTIESKNDYEYVVFEDMKPAGCEPVDVRSGYTGNEMGAYVEFRDNRVAMFVRALARGKHSISYRTRAEIPGIFSALPTRAYAMYAPELKGNADEIKLRISD